MNLRPAANNPGVPTWGSFALVAYLPDPLGSFLTRLRHPFPDEARPDAHITFLPPRPLTLPLEVASGEIRRILEPVKPFSLELGTVQTFPETNILYLSVETGYQELVQLHNVLNRGHLFAEEHFEYIPHVTLGGPLASESVAGCVRKAQHEWNESGLSPFFTVDEMVLLWQPGNCSINQWDRVSAHRLSF